MQKRLPIQCPCKLARVSQTETNHELKEKAMTLQELAQIGGVIGVVASLIYVAIQIRNNSRAVRAATYHQMSLGTASIWMLLAQNPELTSLFRRGFADIESLDPDERNRLMFMMMAYMRHNENAWFQHALGTLSTTDWHAVAADLDSVFVSPGARAMWPIIKNRSNEKFRAHVDAIVVHHAAAASKAVEAVAATDNPKIRKKP